MCVFSYLAARVSVPFLHSALWTSQMDWTSRTNPKFILSTSVKSARVWDTTAEGSRNLGMWVLYYQWRRGVYTTSKNVGSIQVDVWSLQKVKVWNLYQKQRCGFFTRSGGVEAKPKVTMQTMESITEVKFKIYTRSGHVKFLQKDMLCFQWMNFYKFSVEI